MALPKAGVTLVAEGLAAFESGMGRADKAVADFGASGAKAGGAFDKGFGDVVTGALRQVGALGVEALLKAGQAVAGFVKDSIGLAGDFQSGMQEFQAVAGQDVDTKGLEKFQDLFISLGKKLPVSTADVQKAAIEMVKGGIDPATIAAGGLEQNIKFAAAAMGGDLVQAATISSKILGGWTAANATAADKSAFLTSATDLLTKAANASSVDVHELSLGIFNAQGIAKTAGVSFTDLTTTLALLAPRFASSAEAGNSLKNVIARLQPTTKPAIDAMTALGLITEDGSNKFYDAQGNFIGFQSAAQILQDSLQGLTAQQKQVTLQQIFGNDAMNAASALAELGAEGYQHMTDSLAKANGVQENAALKQQGFNTAMENAKGSVEALQITIGSALLPVLTTLLGHVADGVNYLTDMASALFGDEEAFNKLSPAAQSVTTAIEGIVGVIGVVVDATKDFIQSGGDLGVVVDDIRESFGGINPVLDAVIKAVGDIVEWFNQAGDASDTLGGALDDLDGVWNLALKTITDVGNGYMAIAQAVLPVIAKFIQEHGTEISAFFKTTWDSIIQIVTLALQVYDSIVPPILQAIAGFIQAHGDEIQKILSGVWTVITSIITGALETIKGVLKLALDLIHGNWDAAWKDIQAIGQAQWDAIKGALTGFLNAIAGIFNTTLDDIARTWENNWNSLVDIVSRIDWAQVGQSAVDGILQGLRDNWDRLLGWVSDKAGDIAKAALDAIGAGSPATEFMPVGQFAVQGIMVGFQTMWPSLQALVSGLGGDLVDQAQSIADNVQSAMADAFGSTATIDRQKVKNLDDVLKISDKYQAGVQGQLNVVEQEALAMTDPKQAQAWFALRSKQIIELAKLGDQLQATTDMKEKARLQGQYDLINAANNADIRQFQANAQKGGGISDLASQIQKLLGNSDLPGILDNPVIAHLAGLLGQLQAPPASANQIYQGSNTTTNTSTRTYNMPVYTNQSASVLQDSMAMAQAVMP